MATPAATAVIANTDEDADGEKTSDEDEKEDRPGWKLFISMIWQQIYGRTDRGFLTARHIFLQESIAVSLWQINWNGSETA